VQKLLQEGQLPLIWGLSLLIWGHVAPLRDVKHRENYAIERPGLQKSLFGVTPRLEQMMSSTRIFLKTKGIDDKISEEKLF
jgi:hypothetical protein